MLSPRSGSSAFNTTDLKNPALEYTCYNCKLSKVNHFVKEVKNSYFDDISQNSRKSELDEDLEVQSRKSISNEEFDELTLLIKHGLSKSYQREFIEQIIFDP